MEAAFIAMMIPLIVKPSQASEWKGREDRGKITAQGYLWMKKVKSERGKNFTTFNSWTKH